MKDFFLPLCLLAYSTAAVHAQMTMSADTLIQAEQQHGSSGTSVEPASTPVPMWMGTRGAWMLMLHGNGFAANTQQQAQSERGRDAFFSTNWVMPMAQRNVGAQGLLTVRAMFSLEPATVTGRAYPELFQQGETAFGKPIVDGQHPHDFVMELGAIYDLPIGEHALFELYAAPVGDPAVGPTAYPHRLSASEDPIAALGHHQEDSTHIAFNVVTGGLTYGWARVELSGFHGAEPDEHRWQLEPSPNGYAIDSVATRLTIAPTKDIAAQYSIAHITSPELLYPHEDQHRQTASVMVHHTFKRAAMKMAGMSSMAGMDMGSMPGMDMGGSSMGSMPGTAMGSSPSKSVAKASSAPLMQMDGEPATDLATTFVWGRTCSLSDDSKENSYLAEALLRFARSNYVWTRLENAGRSNELLLSPGEALPTGFVESPIGHVAAYTVGYDHDLPVGRHLVAAPGVQFTAYRTPAGLRGVYGDTPTGEVFFVRLRVR